MGNAYENTSVICLGYIFPYNDWFKWRVMPGIIALLAEVHFEIKHLEIEFMLHY
jgi:hypothetical protein